MAKKLPLEIEKQVQEWLKPPFDEETQKQVKFLLENHPKMVIDAFYKTISFGTGGMRGTMGVGTNRLNQYTIRLATQGLSNYILKQNTPSPRVFISYDNRKNSHFFAKETALVLAANEIEVHLTRELRPTPFVSFGCRYLKCTAAVMITASHNSAEYNGYKVYWSDGAQVVSPHDKGIMEEVKKITSQRVVKLTSISSSLIHEVTNEVEQAYFHALSSLQNYPDDNQRFGSTLHIAYSSLHGCGITLMPEALRRWGFTSISLINSQTTPDESFSSAPSPNPEKREALELGIDQMMREQGDFFIASDPDADRLGLVVNHLGKPVILNGNQIAAICIFYLCHTLHHLKKMPKKGAVVTTIVTTELVPLIASTFNLTCFQVLTGFKYIGQKIDEWEREADGYTFIFGAEESLGYLYGTHSRDKDAIISACLISEMALQQKKKGETLVDLLHEIYRKFGLFREKQFSISFGNTQEGQEKMERLMERLRQIPIKEIEKDLIVVLKDYQTGIKVDVATGKKETLSLPKSNVIVFIFEDETKVVIRPSGTEPKIKIYGMVKEKLSGNIDEGLNACDRKLDELFKFLKKTYFS